MLAQRKRKEGIVDYKEIIKERLNQSNGIVLSEDILAEDIPSIYLTRMVKRGEIQRVKRGVYMDKTGSYDEYYFFQKRYKSSVFSYLSALYLHQLTDVVPNQIEVTLYRGYNPHRMDTDVIKHFVTKEVHGLGVIDCITIHGNVVKTYDLERVICDIVKNRKSVDSELFSKTLNNYVRSPKKDFRKLFTYAKKLRVLDKVKEILEIIV